MRAFFGELCSARESEKEPCTSPNPYGCQDENRGLTCLLSREYKNDSE